MKYILVLCLVGGLVRRDSMVSERRIQQKKHLAIPWDSTSNWKIYQLTNFNRVFSIPADSLKYLPNCPLNDDSVHLFLSGITKVDVNPVWMGCYLASCRTPAGETEKVVISYYAGFLYWQATKGYYQLETSEHRRWLQYLLASYMSINQTSGK